jgi:hypothetical protein
MCIVIPKLDSEQNVRVMLRGEVLSDQSANGGPAASDCYCRKIKAHERSGLCSATPRMTFLGHFQPLTIQVFLSRTSCISKD